MADMDAHRIVDKVAGAADEAGRVAIADIDRAAEYAHQTVDNTATGVTPAAALNAKQKKLVGSTRDYVAVSPLGLQRLADIRIRLRNSNSAAR